MTDTYYADTSEQIRNSIARQMADFANQAVGQFLEDSSEGLAAETEIPLLKLTEIVRSHHTRAASAFLKRRCPWISATDVSLGCSAVPAGEASAGSTAMQDVLLRIELMSSSLEAIASLSVELASVTRKQKEPSLFADVLKHLDPFTLNQLEKYLHWLLGALEGKPEERKQIQAKIDMLDEAWFGCCQQHRMEVLENRGEGEEPLLPWKALFIAVYFRSHCLQLSPKSCSSMFPALAMFLDNRDMLQKSGAMDLLA